MLYMYLNELTFKLDMPRGFLFWLFQYMGNYFAHRQLLPYRPYTGSGFFMPAHVSKAALTLLNAIPFPDL